MGSASTWHSSAPARRAARACLEAVRPLGSLYPGHFGRCIELDVDRVAFKQVTVRGSVGYAAETWTRMLAIVAQGQVRLG